MDGAKCATFVAALEAEMAMQALAFVVLRDAVIQPWDNESSTCLPHCSNVVAVQTDVKCDLLPEVAGDDGIVAELKNVNDDSCDENEDAVDLYEDCVASVHAEEHYQGVEALSICQPLQYYLA